MNRLYARERARICLTTATCAAPPRGEMGALMCEAGDLSVGPGGREDQVPLDALLQLLIELVKHCCDSEAASLLLHDPARDELVFESTAGKAEPQLKRVRIPSHLGVAGHVFQTRTPLLVEDARSDPRFLATVDSITGFETRSLMAVPLLTRGSQCRGVVEAVNRRGGGELAPPQFRRLLQAQIPLERAVDAALRVRAGEPGAIAGFHAAQLQVLNLQVRAAENHGRALLAEQTRFERQRQQLLREARIKGLCSFVAGLSHELNNPLGFACANLDSLGDMMEDLRRQHAKAVDLARGGASVEQVAQTLDDPQAIELFEDAIQCVHECGEGLARIADVVRRLNNFGSRTLQGSPGVDLGAVARLAIDRVLQRHPSRSVELELQPMPTLTASHEHLLQAIEVLVDNAVRNSSPSDKVRVDLVFHEGEFLVSVRDSGRGMEQERIEHLFEPFNTDKRADWRGTGLGLSSVHGIVLAHGGRVEVSSAVGVGTTVMISLPFVETAHGDDPPEQPEDEAAAQTAGRGSAA